MNSVKSAVSRFKQGFNYSQALLSTYGTRFGLNREIALRVCSTFGGGMGRMGETCGGVTGALMVIGLRYGKREVQDKQEKEMTYGLVKEFGTDSNLVTGQLCVESCSVVT